MRHKNKIVVLLVGLIAWNSVLGGVNGMLMCLHSAGPIHLASFELSENCCHIQEDDSLHECQNCNDLELDGIDMLVSRTGDVALKFQAACTSEVLVLPEPTWKTATVMGPNPTRAPPVRIAVCLLVAETVVLRI